MTKKVFDLNILMLIDFSALQRQMAVTAFFKNEQLLLLNVANAVFIGKSKRAVTAYFSLNQLPGY